MKKLQLSVLHTSQLHCKILQITTFVSMILQPCAVTWSLLVLGVGALPSPQPPPECRFSSRYVSGAHLLPYSGLSQEKFILIYHPRSNWFLLRHLLSLGICFGSNNSNEFLLEEVIANSQHTATQRRKFSRIQTRSSQTFCTGKDISTKITSRTILITE
jgi:hypothetical protein